MNDKEERPVPATESERLMNATNKAVQSADAYTDAFQLAHDKAVASFNEFSSAIDVLDCITGKYGNTEAMEKTRDHLLSNAQYMKDMMASFRAAGAKHS